MKLLFASLFNDFMFYVYQVAYDFYFLFIIAVIFYLAIMIVCLRYFGNKKKFKRDTNWKILIFLFFFINLFIIYFLIFKTTVKIFEYHSKKSELIDAIQTIENYKTKNGIYPVNLYVIADELTMKNFNYERFENGNFKIKIKIDDVYKYYSYRSNIKEIEIE